MPNKRKVGIKCDVTVQVLLFRTVRHEDMPLANAGAAVLERLGVLSREHYWQFMKRYLVGLVNGENLLPILTA
jgi:hypothetical protein